MCETCEMRFLTPRVGEARHAAVRAELYDCYRRLGRLLFERGAFAQRRDSDPFIPPALAPIAALIGAKIRDLSAEEEATRPW